MDALNPTGASFQISVQRKDCLRRWMDRSSWAAAI
jgi:hypothetical protein